MKSINFSKTSQNKVELLYDGNEYDDFYVELISNAVESIHLQTYIFDIDSFGKKVFEELIAARKRGVEVYILLDAVGSKELKEEAIVKFLELGIKFSKFNGIAFERLHRWGRRLHHKVLLVDSIKAIVGGINIVSPYVDSSFSEPRLDFAVYMEGPITTDLKTYCEDLFSKSFGEVVFTEQKEPALYPGGFEARISVNDWMFRRSQISKDYSDLVDGAQKSITIMSSYFFPRRSFLKKLAAASKRGVCVKLVLAKYSDWPSWILASEYLYYYFLKNNIEIYLWNKSILHGKIASVDGERSTIGSFNLNYTSYQGNLEMNVDIFSKRFSAHLEKEIDALIEDGCEKVDPIRFNTLFSLPKRFFYYFLLAFIANFSLAFIFQEDERDQNIERVTAITHLVIAAIFMLIGLIGLVVPGIMGLPFIFLSFFILSRYILLNKKKDQ